MKFIRFQSVLLISITCFLFCKVQSADIVELSNGLPQIFNKGLPAESYVEVHTKKLVNAKVLWFNFNLARDLGIDFPANGLTPEFEKKVLEAFAYNTPVKQLDPSTFGEQTKTFYADRYGGGGLGSNWGAGRAATAGQFQIKGIGQTSLIGDGQSFDHAHGGASLKESINEAIWGEINHRELPHGGNRVLAIIDSGTVTSWTDGGKETRALIVRQDALRPAHFIPVMYGRGSNEQKMADTQRVKKAMEHLVHDLPQPKNAGNFSRISDKLASGLQTMVKNWGEQYAAAYARRIYHGAGSPSNIEITGRFLDYGTQTSISGFAQVKVLNHVDPFGIEHREHRYTIDGIHRAIEENMELNYRHNLPTKEKLFELFEKSLSENLNKELLFLAGFPENLVTKLARTEQFEKLTANLVTITTAHQIKGGALNIDKVMPEILGNFMVDKIMTNLADNVLLRTEQQLTDGLSSLIPEKTLRDELAKNYKDFFNECQKLALIDGVPANALQTLIAERTRVRNLSMEEVYRPNLHSKNIQLIDRYSVTKNRTPIWDHIDSVIQNSQRTFKLENPYQTVLADHLSSLENVAGKIIYDAKVGKYLMIKEFPINKGTVSFYGHRIPLEKAQSSKLRYTLNHWASFEEVDVVIQGQKMIVKIPLEQGTQEIEMVLRDAKSTQWYKIENQNIHYKLVRKNPALNSCWGKVDLVLQTLI